ncbi:hypothetical protein HDU96_001589 [Phlyctochytrium bullatum]|nr:hypothetical protein HDU96_001589 [Phlyctochytrium bullatum]
MLDREWTVRYNDHENSVESVAKQAALLIIGNIYLNNDLIDEDKAVFDEASELERIMLENPKLTEDEARKRVQFPDFMDIEKDGFGISDDQKIVEVVTAIFDKDEEKAKKVLSALDIILCQIFSMIKRQSLPLCPTKIANSEFDYFRLWNYFKKAKKNGHITIKGFNERMNAWWKEKAGILGGIKRSKERKLEFESRYKIFCDELKTENLPGLPAPDPAMIRDRKMASFKVKLEEKKKICKGLFVTALKTGKKIKKLPPQQGEGQPSKEDPQQGEGQPSKEAPQQGEGQTPKKPETMPFKPALFNLLPQRNFGSHFFQIDTTTLAFVYYYCYGKIEENKKTLKIPGAEAVDMSKAKRIIGVDTGVTTPITAIVQRLDPDHPTLILRKEAVILAKKKKECLKTSNATGALANTGGFQNAEDETIEEGAQQPQDPGQNGSSQLKKILDEVLLRLTRAEFNWESGAVYRRRKTAEWVTKEITELQSVIPTAGGLSVEKHRMRIEDACKKWETLYNVYSNQRSLRWRSHRAKQHYLEEIGKRFAGGFPKEEVFVFFGVVNFGNAKVAHVSAKVYILIARSPNIKDRKGSMSGE